MRNLQIQALIIFALCTVGGGVVHAGNTVIRSHVAAVRIIVVNNNGEVTQIYRNTDVEVAPDVRLMTSDGQRTGYTAAIAAQYQKIAPSLAKGTIGKVYYQPKLPSLIETLYAML